jgi:hypothetical protein
MVNFLDKTKFLKNLIFEIYKKISNIENND